MADPNAQPADAAADPEQRALLLGGAGLVLALYVMHVAKYMFLCDDAFIYFRYADNWAAGLGPVFNPGEHVEGYTGFVWLALLTLGRVLGIAPEQSAPVMGVLAGAGTLLTVMLFARRRFFADAPLWSLAAPALLASNRTFVGWSTGGLETALFTFLVTAGLLRLWSEIEDGPKSKPLSAFLLSAAALTRPDGLLFLGLAGLARMGAWIATRERRREALGAFLLWGVAAAGPVLAHLAWRWSYYGYPLPNTYYAKVSQAHWDEGFAYLTVFAIEYAVVLAAPFAVLAWIKAPTTSERRAITFAALTGGLYLTYVASVGGDHFEFRFVHPLLAVGALIVARGAYHAAGMAASSTARLALGAGLVAALALVQYAMPLAADGYRQAAHQGATPDAFPGLAPIFAAYTRLYDPIDDQFVAKRIELHMDFRREMEQQAEWVERALKEGLMRPEERIALYSIGVVPYRSGLWTLDIHGLADEYVAHNEPPTHLGRIAHEKTASLEYMARREVRYVPMNPWLFITTDQLNHHPGRTRQGGFYAVPFHDRYFVFIAPGDPSGMIASFKDKPFPLFHIENGEAVRL